MRLAARAFRGSAWSFSAAQAAAVMSFAVSIVAARALVPDELGRYVLVTLVVALVTAASSLQMGGFYVVATQVTPQLLRTGLALELAIGAVLFLTVSAAAALYAALSGGTELAALIVVASLVLLTNPFGSLSAFFTRELHYRRPSLAQAGAMALAAALKIVLVLAGAGIWGLVIGDVLLSALYGATMLVLVPAGRGFSFDRMLARQQLSFGIPSLATGLLSTAVTRAPEAVIAALLGTRELGLFYIASRIPAQLYQVGRSLSLALLPAFSRASDDQLERGFRTVTRLSAFFVGLPLAVLLVCAEPLVSFVFGERWSPAATPLVLLTAAVGVRFVLWHVGNLLKARRRVREMTWLTAAQLGALVPVAVLGGVVAGLDGVAASVLLVELAFAPIRVTLARSVVPVRLASILQAPALALALGAAAGLAGASFLGPIASLVFATVASSAVFALVAWLTDGPALIRAAAPPRVESSLRG